MRTPVRVSFHGTAPGQALRREVMVRVDAVERFHGRMTAGDIIIKAPDRRHRTGGLFEINIHLTLPGGVEVNIDRTSSLDERFADPLFALGDAFSALDARSRTASAASVVTSSSTGHAHLARPYDDGLSPGKSNQSIASGAARNRSTVRRLMNLPWQRFV